MANKKQSPKSKAGKSDKGPIMFEENIKKHKESIDDEYFSKQDPQPKSTSAYMIKLVLIGDAAVGKTSIRKRYLGEGFQKEHLATLGADFAATTRYVDDYKIKYQIWDLEVSHESDTTICPQYYNLKDISLLYLYVPRN